MTAPVGPQLRTLDFQPVYHQGEQMWLLRDPWQLSERQLIFPQALAQMLLFCDGTRTVEEIHSALCEHLDSEVPFEAVEDALAELDRCFLLKNGRSDRERQRALHDYRSLPYRPPSLAGLSYPESPQELSRLLQGYRNGTELGSRPWRGRGIVSPHIDYQRGGSVYAQVWGKAKESVLDADLVLIFGTDHIGSPGSITLTHQPYATPFGVLPTEPQLIDRLSDALGSDNSFAEELNHRNEHSIELSAVWLHHTCVLEGHRPVPMIPILVGSFHHFLNNNTNPANDASFNRFLDALRRETRGRRVLSVASVDLAHVGPTFGDLFSMDAERRQVLRQQDTDLIGTITSGNAQGFYQQIAELQDRNRICGFAPLYLMLEYLAPTNGIQVAYDHCPADISDTSLVSICGLLLD